MNDGRITLSFEDVSAAESEYLAEELREILLRKSNTIRLERRRSNPDAQDLGSILELLLVHGIIVSVIEGLKTLMDLHPGLCVTIHGAQGATIRAKGLKPDSIDSIKAFLGSQLSALEDRNRDNGGAIVKAP